MLNERLIAEFDQDYARVWDSVDLMIETYRAMISEKIPTHEAVVGLCQFLQQHMESGAVTEHLAVAISRLASRP